MSVSRGERAAVRGRCGARAWMGLVLSGFLPPAVFAAAALLPADAGAAVWPAEREWSAEWEARYSRWIAEDLSEDFLEPAGLKADCADLAYAIRAVFSRNHGFPFLASSERGALFGHFSTQWDHLPTGGEWHADQRFCRFLRDLFLHTVSTRSLHRDTYPVALTAEAVRPGLLIYEDYVSAHVVTLGRLNPGAERPVVYYESFIPGYARFFAHDATGVRIGEAAVGGHSGVVMWKWPERAGEGWRHRAAEDMPLYSREQFGPQYHRFHARIGQLINRLAFERIHGHPFDENEYLAHLSAGLADAAARRQAHPRSADAFPAPPDEELNLLLTRAWPVMSAYGVDRGRLERRLRAMPAGYDGEGRMRDAQTLVDEFIAEYARLSKKAPARGISSR